VGLGEDADTIGGTATGASGAVKTPPPLSVCCKGPAAPSVSPLPEMS